MRYIKSFESYVAMVGTGTRPELAGELIKDDEDIISPTDMEITGHIGTPIRIVRVQKLGKSPKVKSKIAAPDYPGMQKRTNQNKDTILLNSLPSQS